MTEDTDYWEVPDGLDTSGFDFSWQPSLKEEGHIIEFGTQHQSHGGPRYVCADNNGRVIYNGSQSAIRLPTMLNWELDNDIESADFDWSWHPQRSDVPHNYAFADGAITYINPDAEDTRTMRLPMARIKYKPLDIVYMSNGEAGEQERYDRLCELAGREVIWTRGVSGRENAIRQSAASVSTKWFFLFPGKLWVDDDFDFDYQPRRDYEPKHYIFYATNPLNGLVYGHQAMVCYNTQLVLETIDYGLDFTMSKLHDIVPVNSGIAQYNVDKIITWRTAFREAVKLCAAQDSESKQRLEVWRTWARGENCEWSLLGTQDGIEYYNSVSGKHEELMKTFEWSWLDTYYKAKYEVHK